jgi:hypothetical protein
MSQAVCRIGRRERARSATPRASPPVFLVIHIGRTGLAGLGLRVVVEQQEIRTGVSAGVRSGRLRIVGEELASLDAVTATPGPIVGNARSRPLLRVVARRGRHIFIGQRFIWLPRLRLSLAALPIGHFTIPGMPPGVVRRRRISGRCRMPGTRVGRRRFHRRRLDRLRRTRRRHRRRCSWRRRGTRRWRRGRRGRRRRLSRRCRACRRLSRRCGTCRRLSRRHRALLRRCRRWRCRRRRWRWHHGLVTGRWRHDWVLPGIRTDHRHVTGHVPGRRPTRRRVRLRVLVVGRRQRILAGGLRRDARLGGIVTETVDLVGKPTPVSDSAPVVVRRLRLGVQCRASNGIAPLPAVLEPEESEADAGQTRPQPPAATRVIQRALPQGEQDECDTPQHRDDGNGPHPINVEGPNLRLLAGALLAPTHTQEAIWPPGAAPNGGVFNRSRSRLRSTPQCRAADLRTRRAGALASVRSAAEAPS